MDWISSGQSGMWVWGCVILWFKKKSHLMIKIFAKASEHSFCYVWDVNGDLYVWLMYLCPPLHPTPPSHALSLGNSADKAKIWWMLEDTEFPNKADVELNPGVRKQPPTSTATGWPHLHSNFTLWLIPSKNKKRLFVRTWSRSLIHVGVVPNV